MERIEDKDKKTTEDKDKTTEDGPKINREKSFDLKECCKYNDELMFIKIYENCTNDGSTPNLLKYLIEKDNDELLEMIFYAYFSKANIDRPHHFITFFGFCNDKQKKYILPHILKYFNITLEELLNLLNNKGDEQWINMLSNRRRYKDTNGVIEWLKTINKTSDGKKRSKRKSKKKSKRKI